MERNLENIEDERVDLVVAKTSIMSNSGIKIDYLSPTEDMFRIQDIATGLSNVARFTGQTSWHYSVSQHSVLGSRKFKDPWKAMGFLLHDAHEAYMQDLPSPLKALLPRYKEIAANMQRVIEQKFGIHETMTIHHDEMKEVDYRIYTTERRDLHPWYDISKYTNHPPYDDVTIFPMDSKMAMFSFMKRFKQLKKKMQEVSYA